MPAFDPALKNSSSPRCRKLLITCRLYRYTLRKSRRDVSNAPNRCGQKGLVPKKGLEPPHPCGYMDLNHARLPIPPLRHGWKRVLTINSLFRKHSYCTGGDEG